VGAGIFSVGATAAANYAGPGVILSFIIASVVCALAIMCYAEFASTLPVAGSAYTFSYATMGEFVAWIIGWDLILEMLLAAGGDREVLGGSTSPTPSGCSAWTCRPRCTSARSTSNGARCWWSGCSPPCWRWAPSSAPE
ncbi:amino acid permease, partial [Agrobacterium sp. S2]|nr:amino acid permease [Agrobacterium sp. S2]